MKKVTVPYGSWYLDGELTLTFPEEWNVIEAWPKGAWIKPLSDDEIRDRLNSPIGAERISEIARGKHNVILLIDDLTRPTPTYRFVSFILDELKRGGVEDEAISFLVAMATHRPPNRIDLIKKLGKEVVDKFRIFVHNIYENCEYIGKTSRGTPIYINKKVLEADLKIGIGGIYPHMDAGWSGGGKIICPGASGIETIEANHSLRGGGRGVIEGNEYREDIDEVASKVGLDFIVNVVMNCRREVVGLFAGHMIKAHREGVKFAEKVYSTEFPENMDITVINTYPSDTELLQTLKGLWAAESAKENGTVVVSAYCPEGFGWHSLYDRVIDRWAPPEKSIIGRRLRKRTKIILSPNVNIGDVHRYYPKDTMLFKEWDDVLKKLKEKHGKEANVSVFPCALLQLKKKI